MDEDTFKVALVCTGNQFRSPVAEALLRAAAAGLPVAVVSVGTQDVGAVPALPEAVALAASFGVDISGHRARSIPGVHLEDADLVIGFERAHVVAAVADGGAPAARTFTLVELVDLLEGAHPGDDADPVVRARRAVSWANEHRPRTAIVRPEIHDPFGGSRATYERTANVLRTLVPRLAALLFGPRAQG